MFLPSASYHYFYLMNFNLIVMVIWRTSAHAQLLFLFFNHTETNLNCSCFFFLHISFYNTDLHFYFSETCKYCVIKLYVSDIYVLQKYIEKQS